MSESPKYPDRQIVLILERAAGLGKRGGPS